MTMPAHHRPPLLIQLQSNSLTALEAFLFEMQPGSIKHTSPSNLLDRLKQQSATGVDFNRYIFTQYLMYLYIRIFFTTCTSLIYFDLLADVRKAICQAYDDGKITDRALFELIKRYVVVGDLGYDYKFV